MKSNAKEKANGEGNIFSVILICQTIIICFKVLLIYFNGQRDRESQLPPTGSLPSACPKLGWAGQRPAVRTQVASPGVAGRDSSH